MPKNKDSRVLQAGYEEFMLKDHILHYKEQLERNKIIIIIKLKK